MPEQHLTISLLVLRVTPGMIMLQRGLEKFVLPGTTLANFRGFHGFDFGGFVPPVIGALQPALSLALPVAHKPRITCGVFFRCT